MLGECRLGNAPTAQRRYVPQLKLPLPEKALRVNPRTTCNYLEMEMVAG